MTDGADMNDPGLDARYTRFPVLRESTPDWPGVEPNSPGLDVDIARQPDFGTNAAVPPAPEYNGPGADSGLRQPIFRSPPPHILNAPGDGVVGEDFSYTVQIAGGVAPIALVQAGDLPAGAAWDAGDGTITSAELLSAGTSEGTITATDSSDPPQTFVLNYSITVSAVEG